MRLSPAVSIKTTVSFALRKAAARLVEIEELRIACANFFQAAFQNFTVPYRRIRASRILHKTVPDDFHRLQALCRRHAFDFGRRNHGQI